MVIEVVRQRTEGRAALAQVEGGLIVVEGRGHPGINLPRSSPRDTKILLMNSKDRGTDPSGSTATRIPLKKSLTGQKKTDCNSWNVKDPEVLTDTYRGRTWTLKCPARGGTNRKPMMWLL